MEVILREHVENLGQRGEVVKVADGYARNYLIPQGLVIPANKGTTKQADQIKAAADRRRNREHQAAVSMAERLAALRISFRARASESDRLFGSITTADIAIALEQATGHEINKRQIILEHPLRDLGTHQVPVRLLADVVPEVTVVIEREGEPEAAS